MTYKHKKEGNTTYLYKMSLIAIALLASVFSATASNSFSMAADNFKEVQISGAVSDNNGAPLTGVTIY